MLQTLAHVTLPDSSLETELEVFYSRFDACFARSEPRQHMRHYLRGLLSSVSRKNCWQLAESVGLTVPDPLQRLLYRSPWEADAMDRELRYIVREEADDEPGVAVIDESGFVKKGIRSVGVARQYCGRVGKVENCQVGVFLGYVGAKGHALLDRELYLPETWCQDDQRRAAAQVPDSVRFQTKPQLAQAMLARAWSEGLALPWVTGDTLYGNSPTLRQFIHDSERYYVLAIAKTTRFRLSESSDTQSALEWAASLPEQAWTRCATRAGEKGLIWHDWARLRVIAANDEIGEQWLLIQRSVTHPQDYDFWLSNAPADMDLEPMASVADARHHIEEALQECKSELGMDDYEVRFWHSWYRHITLVMAAHTFLMHLRWQHAPGQKNALRLLDHAQLH